MRILLCNIIAACTLLLLAACNSSAPSPVPAPPAVDHSEHDHAHAHSHAETGPNGGHLVELGDEAYHIEWTHDDATGLVTLYVLDGTAQKFVPIPSEAITITVKVKDSTEYHLAAVDSIGDPPVSAKFELKSPELLVALGLAGAGADVSVALTIDGKDYRGEFERHEHGHNHDH
ncbi:MAG: hypothetical protein ABI614_27670 [Planctomycetota bacterium]